MTTQECKIIGREMAREYYKIVMEQGLPKEDFIDSKEAAKMLGWTMRTLYKHNSEIPHNGRLYSRSAIMQYIQSR